MFSTLLYWINTYFWCFKFLKTMRVAVVGATGMVGEVMLNVLTERNFPITELIPVASERSVGKPVTFKDKVYTIVSLVEAVNKRTELAVISECGFTYLD